MWPKKAKLIWPFFKNGKRPEELKKGQKLQIWLQKSQTGNPAYDHMKVQPCLAQMKMFYKRTKPYACLKRKQTKLCQYVCVKLCSSQTISIRAQI